jgi:hypothetical protein
MRSSTRSGAAEQHPEWMGVVEASRGRRLAVRRRLAVACCCCMLLLVRRAISSCLGTLQAAVRVSPVPPVLSSSTE